MKSDLSILLLSVGLIVLLGCSSNVEAPAANANEAIADNVEETAVPQATELPPTATAVPTEPLPSSTAPLPMLSPTATATATPEPPQITSLKELVGYWEYEGFHTNAGGRLHYFYRIRADGVMEIADSLADLESGEIKARTGFWFDEGVWHTQLVSGFWSNNTCYTGSGKPIVGRYEIRPDADGVLRFFRITDSCQIRTSLSDNDATFTPVHSEAVEWFVDGETGLPLNPDAAPADGRFVLVGTLIALNQADVAAPQASIRLPTGEVVDLVIPPLDSVIIRGEEEVDLAAYDPDYPLRVRLICHEQIDQSPLVEEMVVLATLE